MTSLPAPRSTRTRSSPSIKTAKSPSSDLSEHDSAPISGDSAPAAQPTRGAILRQEISAIALMLAAVFLAGALVAELIGGDSRASVGIVGALIAAPLIAFLGWPAAILTPFVPGVHALRRFGRLGASADRQWELFFGGLVLLLPIALSLALGVAPGEASSAAGLWGAFVAYYFARWFGGFGAWVVELLMLSVLTAATLAWN